MKGSIAKLMTRQTYEVFGLDVTECDWECADTDGENSVELVEGDGGRVIFLTTSLFVSATYAA